MKTMLAIIFAVGIAAAQSPAPPNRPNPYPPNVWRGPVNAQISLPLVPAFAGGTCQAIRQMQPPAPTSGPSALDGLSVVNNVVTGKISTPGKYTGVAICTIQGKQRAEVLRFFIRQGQ